MHTAKSLKSKKIILYFHTTKKTFLKKIYVLACIWALITSLLKSQELGQYFKKNTKKNIFFSLLISGITNLYVKRTPDIKKVVVLFDVSTIRFYPVR